LVYKSFQKNNENDKKRGRSGTFSLAFEGMHALSASIWTHNERVAASCLSRIWRSAQNARKSDDI